MIALYIGLALLTIVFIAAFVIVRSFWKTFDRVNDHD